MLYQETLAALAEAPFHAARWTDVLNTIARGCGAASAQLITFSHHQAPTLLAPGFSGDEIGTFAALGGPDPKVNRGVAAVLKSKPMQVVVDLEYMTAEERRADLLYNEFFVPHGGEQNVFGVISRQNGAVSIINLFRPLRAGEFDDEKRHWFSDLLPGVARGIDLQMQLEDQAATVALGALENVRGAMLLCDRFGHVVGASTEGEATMRRADILTVRHDCICPLDLSLETSFTAALREAARAQPEPRSTTLVAHSRLGRPARIDVSPLPSGRGAATFRPLALVQIQEAPARVRLDTLLVIRAFGLTRTEADVAESLANGMSSPEIAASRGVSLETVSTHVKGVLAKTGCARRAQLPVLLRPFLIP